MNSMTGYGRGSAHDDRLEITVEFNAVNRKSLDILTSLPREWQGMDRSINELLRKKIFRGKVNLQIQVKDLTRAEGLSWDDETVSRTLKKLREFSQKEEIQFEPNSEFLIRLIQAMGDTGELPTWEESWPLVQKAIDLSLAEFLRMRSEEGKALQDDIMERIKTLDQASKQIESLSENTVAHYRDVLIQRLQKLGLEDVNLEDERVLKEISIFADRCDVTEELTRLSSHFEQFRKTAKESGSIGRKLDFLCQEINREINTTGSKANNVEVTRLVLDCKNELERIREQVQNVE